jgi:hypothetical protein
MMGHRGRGWGFGRGARFVRKARVVLLLIALAVGTTRPPVAATTVEGMATSAQAATADRIFVGTVTTIISRPKATAPKYFETVVEFSVEDTVAGNVPATVEITLSGGEVDGVRQRVDGMPELAVGERYVVLLEADQEPPLASPLIGFNQGLYRVVGERRASAVVRDRSGRPLPGDASPAGARGATSDPTLDDFLGTLRAARAR